MEKTILTIDFDIIMWPSVDLYNNIPPGWEQRFLRFPMLKNCIIDYDLYNKLSNLFIYLLKKLNKNNIEFIVNHDEIVSFLSQEDIYHIINIDYHHDWFYEEKDEKQIIELNCGNWVKYLNDNNMLSFYTWINTFNSAFCSDIIENDKIEFFNINEIELEDFFIPDKVFICLSPDWVPPYIEPLYDLWKSLYNNKENFNV